MDPILHEWGGAIIRWVHVVAAMAWVGASFYFVHLDSSLRPGAHAPPGKGGEAWEVHGGGFYQVRKFMVAPEQMPDHLIWHKWQSYSTWISGFVLLCWIYYGAPSLYLDRSLGAELSPWAGAALGIGGLALGWAIYDLLCRSPLGNNDFALGAVLFVVVVVIAYGFQQVFSGRGAIIHTGAVMATIMTGNVFLNIIPGQKRVVASLVAGQAPDPAIGKAAKQRSTHNNYLTLPVVFLMLASHIPHVWSTRWAWAIVALVLVAGAFIRHFYNIRHADKGNPWWMWGVAAACILLALGISLTASPLGRERLGLPEASTPSGASAAPVPPASMGSPGLAGAPHAPGAGVTLVATAAAASPARPDLAAEAAEIVVSRCSMCHASHPVWPGIAIAPKGVMLDTPERIARQADAIRVQSVLTAAMPPSNLTSMELEERRTLANWLATLR